VKIFSVGLLDRICTEYAILWTPDSKEPCLPGVRCFVFVASMQRQCAPPPCHVPQSPTARWGEPSPSSSTLTHLRSPTCLPALLPIASLALYPRALLRSPRPCSRAPWPSLVSPPQAGRAALATTSSSVTLSSPSCTPTQAGITVAHRHQSSSSRDPRLPWPGSPEPLLTGP
jgi:hypothetical protein